MGKQVCHSASLRNVRVRRMNTIIRIELSKNVIVGPLKVISCTVNASRCYNICPFDLDGASNI
jgi:hypothetical protein